MADLRWENSCCNSFLSRSTTTRMNSKTINSSTNLLRAVFQIRIYSTVLQSRLNFDLLLTLEFKKWKVTWSHSTGTTFNKMPQSIYLKASKRMNLISWFKIKRVSWLNWWKRREPCKSSEIPTKPKRRLNLMRATWLWLIRPKEFKFQWLTRMNEIP